MKMLFIAALAVFTFITALSQTQRRPTTYAQTKRELMSLGQKAVVEGVGAAKIVVDDRFTGRTEAVVETETPELLNPKVTITGNRAVVTGRVVFKDGSLHWRTKENSSPVIINFIKRDGQWKLAGLCLGDCGE